MAVSQLTGALRNRHADTPAAFLAELYPGGHFTLASAGHPSFYHNGQKLTLEPGLPLGICREA